MPFTHASIPYTKGMALLGQLPTLPLYTGQVATGCNLHNVLTTKTQAQSRSPHFARDAVTALKLALPGFYVVGNSTEKTLGSPTVFTASIEYPAGTFTQVTFNGSTSGTAPDGGLLFSDFVPVTIPKGALFWVQLFITNATALAFKFTGLNAFNGAKLAYATSGLTDQTATGAITNSGTPLAGTPAAGAQNGYGFYPSAIIAQTTQQSFALIGDSRTAGSSDGFLDVGADQGNLARSIGPFAPYINLGVSSDTLAAWIASHANRLALASLCSGVVLELSINDVTAGATVAAMQANINTIRALFPATTPVYLTTSEPVATQTAIAVSSLVSTNNLCTATVASTANMAVGQLVTIAGSTTAGYNGTFPVAQILSVTTFAYNSGTTPAATPAAGTVTVMDLWAHPENQTTNANNANRVALNGWKRTVPTGFKATLDIADVVEAGRDAGVWTNRYGQPTSDGTHALPGVYLAIQRSGVISPLTML